jgi:hypothetical protein
MCSDGVFVEIMPLVDGSTWLGSMEQLELLGDAFGLAEDDDLGRADLAFFMRQ